MAIDTSELDALEAEQQRRWEALDAAGANAAGSPFVHLLMGVRQYGYKSPTQEYLEGNTRHARFILGCFDQVEALWQRWQRGEATFKYEIGEEVIAQVFLRLHKSTIVDRQFELAPEGGFSCKYQLDHFGGIWTGEAHIEKMREDFKELPSFEDYYLPELTENSDKE